MIRAVLFDLDGTVINTNELVLKSWEYALQKNLGFSPCRDELIRYFGEPLTTTARRFDENKADRICDTYKKYNQTIHDSMVQGYEGMEYTMRKLKELGIKIGIVTSKRRSTTEKGLRLFNLLELMDIIVTVEDTERHKPNGDPLIRALDILGVSVECAIYVGDTHYDILCARNAGCRACFVKYSMLPFEELSRYNPDFVIDKPVDLLGIVTSSVVPVEK